MKDSKNREMMAKLYRIIEKYEEPPSIKKEESESYFVRVWNDLSSFYNEYKENEFATALSLALNDAICKRVARVNKWEG